MTQDTVQTDQDHSMEMLHELLKPGDTIHTVLRHVSKSGMTRWIDLYKINDGDYNYLSGYAASVGLGKFTSKHDGIKVEGCGMDMGFAIVYDLGRRMFPDGFIPLMAKMNGRNGTNPSERDTDGGYALKQRWI